MPSFEGTKEFPQSRLEEEILSGGALLLRMIDQDLAFRVKLSDLKLSPEMELLELPAKSGGGKIIGVKEQSKYGPRTHSFDPKYLLMGILASSPPSTGTETKFEISYHPTMRGEVTFKSVYKIESTIEQAADLYLRCGKTLGITPENLVALSLEFSTKPEVRSGQPKMVDARLEFHSKLREEIGLRAKEKVKGIKELELVVAELRGERERLLRENSMLREVNRRLMKEVEALKAVLESATLITEALMEENTGLKVEAERRGEGGSFEDAFARVLVDRDLIERIPPSLREEFLKKVKKSLQLALHPDNIPDPNAGDVKKLLEKRLQDLMGALTKQAAYFRIKIK